MRSWVLKEPSDDAIQVNLFHSNQYSITLRMKLIELS